MVLRVAGEPDLLQGARRTILGFLENLRPLGGVSLVKFMIKPVQYLFGRLFNTIFQTSECLFLAAGKEEPGCTKNFANKIVCAQVFGVLLGDHGLPALLSFLGSGVAFEMQRFLGRLGGGDGVFEFVGVGFGQKEVERGIVSAEFANIGQHRGFQGGKAIANP